MRKKLILLLAVLLALYGQASAQIFQSPYKRALKKAERKALKEIKNGSDFVIDPIESTPVSRRNALAPSAQTNWGRQKLLTPALEARLAAECTFPVTVKVYDTGQPDHRALLKGQIVGSNYTGQGTAMDKQGHSTHVTGIIASEDLGLCDVLVDKALLTHKTVKVLSDQGSGSFAWVASALAGERADDLQRINAGGFVVCNGSFGGGTGLVESVEAELKKSTDAGVVFLFAAGNTGQTGVNYPGNGKYSIACASLDQSGKRSSYSTMGNEVWSAMPGRDIQSTYLGQQWATLSGTSMATPFLTAATAIAFSKWGNKLKSRGLDGVRAYLAWCASDIPPTGKDPETGWGIELVQNILDRDPANTPKLPGDPTPPPPNPPSGLVSIDPLPVSLKSEFSIVWDNVKGAYTPGMAKTFKLSGRGSRKANRGLANKITLVRFEILVPSSEDSDMTAAKIEAATADYFKNRGFMLPPGQDASWAAYWSAYFLEMGLSQGKKIEVDVLSVTLKTKDGQSVVIKDLKHWPLK